MDHPLDGTSLQITDVLVAGSQARPRVVVDPAALDRVASSWELAEALARSRPVYGRTTGVGANRDTDLSGGRDDTLRLLRSHATGAGPVLDVATTRMAMLIRLNQILAGGSGMHPGIVPALVDALGNDAIPQVHRVGPIGTGDLSGLAEIGLGLAGESPLHAGSLSAVWEPATGDALPFISSNAVTFARACVAVGRLRSLRRHLPRVVALSFAAMRASREPLHEAVQGARGVPGQDQAARQVRRLLAAVPDRAARVQDSFGYRVYPQVAGGLLDSAARLESLLTGELNAAAENPLIYLPSGEMFHNGNFHAMALGLAVDQLKLALAAVAQLSLSRVADLASPAASGLNAFLADGTPGSSGMMLLEYVQAAAQQTLRQHAQPATLAAVSISRGTENHAGFATQAVDQLHACLDEAAQVLACELITALRALALRGDVTVADGPLGEYVTTVRRLIDPTLADRPLTADLAAVEQFLLTAATGDTDEP